MEVWDLVVQTSVLFVQSRIRDTRYEYANFWRDPEQKVKCQRMEAEANRMEKNLRHLVKHVPVLRGCQAMKSMKDVRKQMATYFKDNASGWLYPKDEDWDVEADIAFMHHDLEEPFAFLLPVQE